MSNAHPHFAKSLLFTCIDERLYDSDTAFVKQINGAFHPAMAGGGHALVHPDHRASAITQIIIGYKVNKITDVYLQSHLDCGAYGLAGIKFDSEEAEIERLYADLDVAAGLVQAALRDAGAQPDEVQTHVRLVDLKGQVVPRPAKVPALAV